MKRAMLARVEQRQRSNVRREGNKRPIQEEDNSRRM